MFEAVASKAAILAVAAHGLMLLLRRRSAAERHLVWVLTFLAILVLPWMERTAPAVVLIDRPIATTIAATAVPEVPIQPSADWPQRIWLGGCVSIALYQMAGIVLLVYRRRFLRPFPVPQWPARVYTSRHANVPMTWGMVRPVIVLPESAVEWPAERLRIVLLHESAHIARFDFATQLLARLVCALHWFNPLLWLGAAAMRREQEQACDNAVLKLAVKGSDYAQLLLDLATNKRLPTLSIPMAQTNNLESRIRAALDPARFVRIHRTTIVNLDRVRYLEPRFACVLDLLPSQPACCWLWWWSKRKRRARRG
jgi:beta-lactamase regulating signal transducer with metallopeptidase domain